LLEVELQGLYEMLGQGLRPVASIAVGMFSLSIRVFWDGLKGPQEFFHRTTADGEIFVLVKVFRLPDDLIQILEESLLLLGETIKGKTMRTSSATDLQCSHDDGSYLISAMDSELESVSAQVETLKSHSKTLVKEFGP
jgi:hypothetical protein